MLMHGDGGLSLNTHMPDEFPAKELKMNTETTIVEINGVKMEVDLRHAKIVHENIRVGSKVKLLEKGNYNGPVVHPGVVVGFENFQSLPTIIVAYVKLEYGTSTPVQLAHVNASKASMDKWEMVPAHDDDMPVRKKDVLDQFDRDIAKAKASIDDLEQRRAYFLRHFGVYFSDLETA